MATMTAQFDGKVFVPCGHVDLPAGTTVEVVLPQAPRVPTPAENREWQQILHEISSSTPQFETVEDALRYSRKRP
jgi:hypothetical protein